MRNAASRSPFNPIADVDTFSGSSRRAGGLVVAMSDADHNASRDELTVVIGTSVGARAKFDRCGVGSRSELPVLRLLSGQVLDISR
ncbi:hypothetical protein ACIGO9_30405 [Nocardia asteroides]|uniref:hypothetical protein n=1 Tax=Nocardia asteroides TaxID=1824 RepID=UPI0037C7530A